MRAVEKTVTAEGVLTPDVGGKSDHAGGHGGSLPGNPRSNV